MRFTKSTAPVLVALLLACFLLLLPSPVRAAPGDISGHWAARDIGLLLAKDAAEIYADGTFRPDRPVTRAETVAMVVSGFDFGSLLPARVGDPIYYPEGIFADIGRGHWFEAYAYTAVDEDLIAGYPDGTFEPEGPITRAELATLIHRIFESPTAGAPTSYSDSPRIPDWAREAVGWASSMGFVRGFPDGSFRPGALTTRAEVVTILRRALDYRGILFDLSGQVIDRSMSGSRLDLLLNDGNTASLDVGIIPVYRGEETIYRREVARGDTVGILLDRSGEVIWLEALHRSLVGTVERVSLSEATLRVTPWEPGGWGDLSSWAELGFWTAAGRPQTGGIASESITLHWGEGTEFYRQGIRVSASALRPGDRVYAHLAATGPDLLAADAVSYDSWGEILEVDGEFESVTWSRGGDEVTANLTANSRIEYAGRIVGAGSLREGARIGVVLSRDGHDVLYAEAYDRGMPGLIGVAAMQWDPDTDWRSGAAPSNPDLLGITALREELGVDGSGVTVAVVDTGIDPGTPDLWSEGGPNLVDWKDFTGSGSLRQRIVGAPASRAAEGDVFLRTSVQIEDGQFEFEGRSFQVRGRGPADGVLRVGWIRSEVLGVEDGTSLLVGAGRSTDDGDFDLAYVDTDGDGVLRSDEVFRAINAGGGSGVLYPAGSDGPAVNFVVADLDSRGEGMNIGYDGNGHGTQVANAIAGTSGDYPPGSAPGIDLMALKALSTSGSGTWEEVLRAVRYAAERGADIINVSVTGAQDLSAGGSRESRMLREISDRYGVLIITAVGNAGPGLATAFTPGDVHSTLAVGAANIPEIVFRDYGYTLAEPGVWQHSSVGPRADGALAPGVLGPASAYVPTAQHLGSADAVFFEGTSCAAAHVTGLAALLVEAARSRDLDYSMAGVKRALEIGAVPLSGYLVMEQGFGLIDPRASWSALLGDPRGSEPFRLAVDSAAMVERPYAGTTPGGVYLRSMEPGSLNISLVNRADEAHRVRLDTEDLPSVVVPPGQITIPGNGEVTVPVRYGPVSEGHVESGFLVARSVDTPGLESRLLHTLVNPIRLGPDRRQLTGSGTLEPGAWNRYFVEVPPGISGLEVELVNPGGDTGRITVQLVDPDGASAFVSPHVGVGGHGVTGNLPGISRTIDLPRPGVWEVNVSSSASLSFYGLRHSAYELRVSLVEEAGLMLTPERSEWRFLPGEEPDFRDVHVAIDAGPEVDVGALSPYGHGWFSDSDIVRLVPRQWLDHQPGEAHYREVEVAPRTDRLSAWAGNATNYPRSPVELYIYAYDEYGSVVPKAEGLASAHVSNPSPGRYLVVARSQSEERTSFEFAVDAWPEVGDIRVFRLGTTPETARLIARLGAPREPGRYWAAVGLRDSEGRVVAETVLRVEVGRSGVLVTVAPAGGSDGDMAISVRLDDGRPAPGVLLFDGRIHSLDSAGKALLSVPDRDRKFWRGEIRYGSPEGEWTAPIDLRIPLFSDSETRRWRERVLPRLDAGTWSSPLALRRLVGFLRGG